MANTAALSEGLELAERLCTEVVMVQEKAERITLKRQTLKSQHTNSLIH